MRALGVLLVGALLIAACGEERATPAPGVMSVDSAGVEIIAMDQMQLCEGCRLERDIQVTIDAQTGPGAVESEYAMVEYGPDPGLYVVGWGGAGVELDLFDEDGTYLRSIGSEGEGPGELAEIPQYLRISDRDILGFDRMLGKWIAWDHDGRLLSEQRSEARIRALVPAGGEEVLIYESFDTQGDWAGGQPLRAFDRGSGQVLADFGLRTAADSALRYVSWTFGRGRNDGEVVLAWLDRQELEEWSIDGTLLRVLRGRPPAFPDLVVDREPDDPPSSRLIHIAFDSEGILWTLTMVPAPTWAEFRDSLRAFTGGATGPVELSATQMQGWPRQSAPRIDAFDMVRGEHLGSWESGATAVRPLMHDGEVWFQSVELDETLQPSLLIFRMQVVRGG